MNGLHTEYTNLTPYHIRWLDGCGKLWVGNRSVFSKYIPNEASVCYSILTNSFEKCRTQYYEENNYTHCPTGDAFCQGVAKILGIEYVPEKAEIKGMAIEVSRLSEEDRGHLSDFCGEYEHIISVAEHNNEAVSFGCGHANFAPLDFYKQAGYTITESPNEFLKYVAQQTGKEYKPNLIGKEFTATFLDESGEIDAEAWEKIKASQLMKEFPHKAYRILDSLDNVQLDKRIPLSEWVPPYKGQVAVIKEDCFFRGTFYAIVESGVEFKDEKGMFEVLPIDGHWMKIV